MTRAGAALLVILAGAMPSSTLHVWAVDEDDPSDAPHAADVPETVRVEGIGDRAPTDLTGAVTIIHAADFASRITSLPRLLDEVAGLRVRAYGGLGSFATVSIRGSTAEQVNIYMDGVLLNPALGGGVNLADLSLASIDTIEIYRGFTPSFLTAGSIGGAINIRTKRPAPPSGASTRVRVSRTGAVSYGSYQTGEAAGTISLTGRRHDGLFSGELTRGEGDFRFFDNNGTTLDGGDDRFATRRNNDFTRADLLGRAGAALGPDGRIDFQAGFATRAQGVPGIDALQSEDARARGTRALFKAGYSNDSFLIDTLRLNLDISHTRTTQQFEDRSGDTTGGRRTDSQAILDATTLCALYRWHPAAGRAGHHITVLESVTRETAALTDRLDEEPGTDRSLRTGVAFSLEDEIHLAGSRLIVSPSVRWERVANRFDQEAGTDDTYVTARLGGAWHARKDLTLRAGAGRFVRQPSFLEIFGDQGAVKGGGPGLLAEKGVNYDIGMTWDARPVGRLDSFHIETTLFSRQASELIQFILTSQSQVVARNTGRARVTGAELSTSLALFSWFDGGFDYTWQVAEDRSDTFARGNDLPGRPRHEVSARAGLRTPWGRPFYTFDYVGPNYFDAASATAAASGVHRDLYRVPGRYIHGIGFTAAAGRRAEVTVQVDNIFDVLTVDVARYPLPGRVVSAKLRVSLP